MISKFSLKEFKMEICKNALQLWIFILILHIKWGNVNAKCSSIKTLGHTFPEGDIVLEYGESLNLICVLNESKVDSVNASSEIFFTNGKDGNLLPKEMVEVINSTSARLFIEHPNPMSDGNFECYYKNKSNLVCGNVVIVGVKPQNITDFACISRNFDNLTCTWTEPNNYVITDYYLIYSLKSSKNNSCPRVERHNSKMSCFWNISTSTPYRLAHPKLNFTLSIKNIFGSITLEYQFDHYKHVIPNAPENLKAQATSSHSISLSWQLPSSMKTFPVGVHHRILYQCEYYPKKWQFGGIIRDQLKKENVTFVLNNLRYAHALCDIRVSMRSSKADDNDEMAWSENATKTVRTESKIPDGPPEVNIGSFEIFTNDVTRNILVYWNQIKDEARNGQNFKYKVEIQDRSLTNYSTKSYIEFKNLPATEYKINIWSQNDEGLSAEKSTLIIPAQPLPEPQHFMKIVHAKSEALELKWDPPNTNVNINNYTIFWCTEYERSYTCDGSLEWLIVPSNVTQYNLALPKNSNHLIAISANGIDNSSGMLRADCTIRPGRSVNKLKNVWINRVGSDFIDIEWKFDCADQISGAMGFIIYYCQIVKAQTDCIDKVRNVTIMDKKQFKGQVHSLRPYRTYQLTVAVILSNTTFSQSSEPMYNTTSEAAPSTPPLNVHTINKTDSTITIHWNPPAEINGKLKYYRVHVNGNTTKLEANKNNYTFTNLDSYVTYVITVEACTVACSEPSQPLIVTTDMNVPGQIPKPVLLASSSTQITLGWLKPDPPRGKTDYYQLKLAFSLKNETDDTLLNVTNSQNYSTSCDSKKAVFYVYVRAVNIIGAEHKYGPWTEPFQISSCASPSQFLYITIVVILFIIVVAAVYFAFKKLYFYFKSMKDVQVKLPPGLQTVVDQQPWVSSKHSEDIDRTPKPDPDEELLLDKFPDNRLGLETSIMGSPHETMTTSMESGPHLTSDLMSKTSLRQRNKGFSGPDCIKASQAPGNYSVVGIDPSKTISTETRYLPGLESDNPPPGYVAVDDIVKMPNPGYIPFTAAEPDEKNKGYVMAGMPKDMLVHDLLQCESQKPFDEKALYVRASDTLSPQKGNQFPWEQPPLDTALVKSGYVSVGDVLPPKNVSDVSKGYIPHRQFDATKSIKED